MTDAALTLNAIPTERFAIARPDIRDWYALPDDQQDYLLNLHQGVAGLRIAFSPGLAFPTEAPRSLYRSVG